MALTPGAANTASDHLEQYTVALGNRLDALRDYVDGKLDTHDRELPIDVSPQQKAQSQELISRIILNGQPKEIWHAYTDPISMARWSPPLGTHVVHCENRLKVGAIWKLIVRNTSGIEFGISGIYREVTYPKKLVFTDGIGIDPSVPRPESLVTITFEATDNGKTLLTRHSTASPAIHQLNAAWFAAMAQ